RRERRRRGLGLGRRGRKACCQKGSKQRHTRRKPHVFSFWIRGLHRQQRRGVAAGIISEPVRLAKRARGTAIPIGRLALNCASRVAEEARSEPPAAPMERDGGKRRSHFDNPSGGIGSEFAACF